MKPGALVGYARVSRPEQVMDRQLDALEAEGCTTVFTDQGVSGTRKNRPGLDECLAYLRPGDTLVVQALDRLGRNTRALLELVEDLHQRDVSLRILTLGIDTGTPAGKLVLVLLAGLAEMERSLMLERTQDAIRAARARGRIAGRKPSLSPEQVRLVGELHGAGRTQAAIAEVLGTSPRTVRRALERLAAEKVLDSEKPLADA